MAKYDKRLEGMRNNPQNDWKIADVEALCRSYGIDFTPPTRGSHAKASDPTVSEILTIPFARPIKAIYIKKLVSLVDDVLVLRESEERLKAIESALAAASKSVRGSEEQ